MNSSTGIRPEQSTFPANTVIRVAAAAAIIVAAFVIGYSAPVDRVFAQDAHAPVAAQEAYGNGPTGYFPAMFEDAERAAQPVEPIEAF